ncbi:MAG: condensation domain-containing protein, partial [Gemmatimonadaceae bacterium]
VEEGAGAASGVVPIGRPLARVSAYVLDGWGELTPTGVVGELYLGGVQVARGYMRRPALTGERFVPDPFGSPGDRLYRTGDLARWLPDGTLEFLGRTDFQVKVRGHRIELGEIEAVLLAHPDVRQAVVVARDDGRGEQQLVAYVVGAETLGADTLRGYVSERLPAYMAPPAYVRLEALPLTPNRKVDRNALPAPDGSAYKRGSEEAPIGDIEQMLAELWSDLLHVEQIGRYDDFFAFGGHSLLAVRMIERMRQLGLAADVRTLFTSPTIADLAAAVSSAHAEAQVPPNSISADCDAITPDMLPLITLTQAEIDAAVATVPGGAMNVQDIYPLAPLQEGMLFHYLTTAQGDPYLTLTLTAFDSRARLDEYLAALQAVIDRHDILRTGLVWAGVPEPVQVVRRRAPLVVEEVVLDAAAGDGARQLAARFDSHHTRIDLRQAPLLRAYVAWDAAYADGAGRWLLVLLHHHAIGDLTTYDVMEEEITAHLAGEADRLPPPVPFRNFIAQVRLS